MTGTPHPSWTPTTILRLLEERAATLQRMAETADTLAELADVDAAAAELRLIRLELTDPPRQRSSTPPAVDDDVDSHTEKPTA